ncbi:MAG TPA: hypothetical protein VK208_11475 [Pyrinomonadaceae bacterium]|nr:hypothetical protein [Pyrinomonadaceae bacterium]
MNTNLRNSEQGGTRLKFLLVVTIIAVVAYAGYQFIPVAYNAYQLRDLMQHEVDTAVALGKPTSWITEQLVKSSAEYGIPPNAVITPQQQDDRMEVRVQFSQPIEFPGFVYTYEFDHTAKSATFLSVK